MIKFNYKKIVVFLLLILSLAVVFTACVNKSESALSPDKQTDTVDNQKTSSNEETQTANSKTDEIFDAIKYKGKLTIRFFNTDVPIEGSSEGDLILITSPDGANMLIDAGLPESGEVLVEYLKKLNIEKLDYAVCTHMHIDHIGGYIHVLNNFEVSKMFFPNFTEYNSKTVKTVKGIIEEKNIPVEIVKTGDTIKLGESVEFEVLAPEEDIIVPNGTVPEKSNGFINNNSIVLRMTYMEKTFLFPADIYWEREDILIAEQGEKLKVDLLKVPHHGSSTSSSFNFVNAVEPEYAVITSRSPDKEVYDRYKRKGTRLFITGLDGNILVICDGTDIEVIQEHERKIKGYYE